MDPCNQFFNQLLSSNDTCTEEVPKFVTYLNMIIILLVATVVITPAVMVINVIWWTTELHTKYYFLVANLLAADIATIISKGISQYLIMILYLLDLNSEFAVAVLKSLFFPLFPLNHFMTVLLPITLAMERFVVIVFPYRHRSIMTAKTVISIIASMWGLSLILTIMITIIVPVSIVWPLALIYYNPIVVPFFVLPRLMSAAFIIVTSVILHYKVVVSNRRAKENQKLGNEEEAKQLQKIVEQLRAQVKPIITLLLVGGIDVIGNVIISFMYSTIKILIEPMKGFYIEQFLMHPITTFLLLSHSLVYGLYVKKIRKGLPECKICQNQWKIRHSKVVTLHQQH